MAGALLAFEFQPRTLMELGPGQRGDALHEIKDAFGLSIFFAKHGFNILVVSDLDNPFSREKLSRSSSVSATIRARAALIPATNSADEELEKLVNAGRLRA